MLNELISRANLEEMAGATAFQRGETYFAEGAVGLLRATDDKLTARVEGSEIYQVELWGDDDELAYDCTCPRAADGYFCKHCVAVGLAWPGWEAGVFAPQRCDQPLSPCCAGHHRANQQFGLCGSDQTDWQGRQLDGCAEPVAGICRLFGRAASAIQAQAKFHQVA